MSGRTLGSDMTSSSSLRSFFTMSGRRLSSQRKNAMDIEVVSVPATLYHELDNLDPRISNWERNVQVSNAFRDDVVVGHLHVWCVTVFQKALEHRMLLRFSDTISIHLRTHFIHMSSNELLKSRVSGSIAYIMRKNGRTSARILSELHNFVQRSLGIRQTRCHAQVGTTLR